MKIDFGWMAEAFEDEYAVYNEVNDAPIVTEDIIRSRVQIGLPSDSNPTLLVGFTEREQGA